MSEMSVESDPIRVLEIGYGANPAVKEGTLFQDPNVHYVGIELPMDFEESYRNEFVPEDFSHIEADMAALPFRTDSFDRVLMRSIFGQFIFAPQVTSAISQGLHEVRRVLKPNGEIVVAEENGALPESEVRSKLVGVGLAIDSCVYTPPMEWRDVPADHPWKVARSPYYTKKPRLMFPTEHYGQSYLLIGHKPENLEIPAITIPSQSDKSRQTV